MNRLIGLHYARGIAALFVVYAHLVPVAFFDPESLRAVLGAGIDLPIIPQEFWANHWLRGLEDRLAGLGFQSGPFGVGLFFLISGYVIPMSLRARSPGAFMVGRILRIYPVMWVALVVQEMVVGGFVYLSSDKFPYQLSQIFHSAALTYQFAGVVPVNGVLWSLLAEMFFYVLVFFVYLRMREFNLRSLGVINAVLFFLLFVYGVGKEVLGLWSHGFMSITRLGVFLTFIMVGCVFFIYDHTEPEQKSLARFFGAILAQIFAFALFVEVFCSLNPEFRPNAPSYFSYGLALAIFVAFLRFEKWIPRSRIAKFFGDISYPLYLIHGPLGWLALYLLIRETSSMAVSYGVALVGVTAVAWAIHALIETPVTTWSKKSLPSGGRKRSEISLFPTVKEAEPQTR